MFFSIIVPCFNVKDYLRESVASIFLQTFDDYEVILVDDGSIDGTSEICDELAKEDKRIVVIHQNNQGLFNARNNGYKVAKGDYILGLDSDDCFANKQCFSFLVDVINKYNCPDFVMFKYKRVDKPIPDSQNYNYSLFNNIYYYDSYNIKDIRKKFVLGHDLNSIVSKVIKRDFLLKDNNLYSNVNNFGEDAIKSIYLFGNAKTIVIMDYFLYLYRNNYSSITRKKKEIENISKMFNIGLDSKRFELLKMWKLDTDENCKILASHILENRLLTNINSIFSYDCRISVVRDVLSIDYTKYIPPQCFYYLKNNKYLHFWKKMEIHSLVKKRKTILFFFAIATKMRSTLVKKSF